MKAIKSLDDLIDLLRGEKDIYIYGAGTFGKRIYNALEMNGIEASGFLVTERTDNPDTLNGKPVYSLTEDDVSELLDAWIIMGFIDNTGKPYQNLLHMGFLRILRCLNAIKDDVILPELKAKCEELENCDYVLDADNCIDERLHGALLDKATGKRMFRFRTRGYEYSNFTGFEYCSMEAYERQYGRHRKIPFEKGTALSDSFMKEHKFEIYAATAFKDKVSYEGTGLIPIQISAAFDVDRLGYITDDMGDNIAEKNKDFCECTALYWVWKNTKGQDYVGLCHYRRRFRLFEESINYIKENKIDVVTTLPQYIDVTVKKFFQQFITEYDWGLFKASVSAYSDSYGDLFEAYENSHFFIVCNLGIMTREWFDRYCEFAFAVAKPIEDRYKHIFRQDRYMGYIFENMLSFFLMVHQEEMNIACTDMVFLR